jgi:hypothetical protein
LRFIGGHGEPGRQLLNPVNPKRARICSRHPPLARPKKLKKSTRPQGTAGLASSGGCWKRIAELGSREDVVLQSKGVLAQVVAQRQEYERYGSVVSRAIH